MAETYSVTDPLTPSPNLADAQTGEQRRDKSRPNAEQQPGHAPGPAGGRLHALQEEVVLVGHRSIVYRALYKSLEHEAHLTSRVRGA